MTDGPIFDKAATLERVEGDLDLLHTLVTLTVESYVTEQAKIKEALRANDAPAVAAIAHSLKGAFGNIGAARCFHQVIAIEASAKAGLISTILKQLELLDAEFKTYQAEVKTIS